MVEAPLELDSRGPVKSRALSTIALLLACYRDDIEANCPASIDCDYSVFNFGTCG